VKEDLRVSFYRSHKDTFVRGTASRASALGWNFLRRPGLNVGDQTRFHSKKAVTKLSS